MADEKISDMPLITNSEIGDEYTLVRSADNWRCTRLMFMTAITGEQACWQNTGGSFVGIQTTGHIEILPETGKAVFIGASGATGIQWSATGSISLVPPVGQTFSIVCNIGSITISNTGNIVIQNGTAVSVFVSFVTTGAGNWAGGLPSNLAAALDRIATALVVRTGGVPIP